MKKFYLIVAVLLVSNWIYAQSGVKLAGEILDSQGNQLTGANVLIEGTHYGTASDHQGQFSFSNLRKGKYSVAVSFLGYENQIKEVDLQKDEFMKFELEISSFITDEIIVQATRAGTNTPMAYENIKADVLAPVNVGQDLPVLLDLSPSVVTTTDAGAGVGYTGIRIRGSDATRVNVTINGIPVNDPESHGVWWVNMPDIVSSVEDVQIQRGVGTSTNGAGAFGASINLQTENLSRDPYSQLDVSGGSFNTHKETFKFGTGMINDKFNFSGRLSNIMSDGYIDRASSDLKSYFLSGSYRSEKTLIKLLGFGGKERTYQSWNGIDAATMESSRTFNSAGAIYDENWEVTDYYNNEVDNYQQQHAQLLINHQLSEHLSANLNFHYTRGLGYYEQYRQFEPFEAYSFEPLIIGTDTITNTDLIRRKWLDNHFAGTTFNLHYNSNKLNLTWGGGYNNYFGNHYGEVIWARFSAGSEKNDRYYGSDALKKDFNSYLKANYHITDKFSLFADMQLRSIDYNTEGTDEGWEGPYSISVEDNLLFFNPKAGAFYKLSDQQHVFASFAVANREPNRTDYLGNEDKPSPETLYDSEIGYRISKPKYTFAVNGYYMNYVNQLVLTGEINDVGAPIRSNTGKSYRTGIEIVARWSPVKSINWQFNLNLSDNKNVDYKTQDSDTSFVSHGNTLIAYSPSIVAGNRLTFIPIENMAVSFTSKYVGEQYMSNDNIIESKLEDYFISNLNISYTLKKAGAINEVTFNALVNNIFNTEYSSNGYMWDIYPYYYPQAGINFLAGVSIKF